MNIVGIQSGKYVAPETAGSAVPLGENVSLGFAPARRLDGTTGRSGESAGSPEPG